MPHVDRGIPTEGAEPHPDLAIARLAARQAGRVGRWQLLAAGLTADRIDERLRSRHLHPVTRSVYAVGHAGSSPRSARFAAWLAHGPDAAVSHFAAAAELDLRTWRGRLVDVTTAKRARGRPGVRVHQSPLPPEDIVIASGLPVTNWARTTLDLAPSLPPADVTKMLERAEKLGLYDGRALDALLRRSNGHRGMGKLARAAAEIDPRHDRTRSGWERDVLPQLDALGLRPKVNHRLGPYEFDLYFERERVVVELDSWEHHGDRAAFEADRERDRWCAAHRILPLRFTWRQVRDGALSELVPVLAARR